MAAVLDLRVLHRFGHDLLEGLVDDVELLRLLGKLGPVASGENNRNEPFETRKPA